MVVWKEHVENLADLSAPDAAHFMRVHQAAERALLDVTGAERAILMKLGIATPHLHMHIYPVSRALSRSDVMAIIDGLSREDRDPTFVAFVRGRIDRVFRGE